MGLVHPQHVTSELDRHDLHAEAQAETWNVVLARVLGGPDLALDTARTEASRDDDAIKRGHAIISQQTLYLFGLDPYDLHFGAVVETGVTQ